MEIIVADKLQEVVKNTEKQFFQIFVKNLRRQFAWTQDKGIELIVSMEGWNISSDGEVELLSPGAEIPTNQYETWISVFLFQNGHILQDREEGEVPSSCVKALKLSANGKHHSLDWDDCFVQKSEKQLKEILKEWESYPQNYEENIYMTTELLNRAKYCEAVF